MEIAALAVGMLTLVSIADTLAPGTTAGVTLDGEQQQMTAAQMVEAARDMARQRNALLADLGAHRARLLLATTEQCFRAAYEAEGKMRTARAT